MIDCFRNTFIAIKRNKKNRYIFIISIICSLIVMLSITVHVSFQNYIKNNYEENVGFRTLDVFYNENEKNIVKEINNDKLRSIDHVIDVYNSKYHSFTGNSSFKDEKYNGIITLTSYTESTNLHLVYGEDVNDRKNVAVCPRYFYPDSSINQKIKLSIDKKGFLSSKELLNKNFEFYYYSYEDINNQYTPEANKKNIMDFTIVGLYDATTNFSNANQCYVSFENIKSIVDLSNPGTISSSYVVVDNVKNIDNVMNEINNLGYVASVANYFDYGFVNTFKIICMIITTVFIFIAIVLLSLYVNKKIVSEYKDIGIKRAAGYSLSKIRKEYLFEILFLLLMTFIINCFIFVLLYILGINTFLKSIEVYGISIVINLFVITFTFVGTVLIPYLIAIFQVFVKTNKDIIIYLKSEE